MAEVDLLNRSPAYPNRLAAPSVRFPDTSPPGPPLEASTLQPEASHLASFLDALTKPLLSAEVEVKENRSSTGSGPDWEPLKLMPRHREIMRRLLEGATYIEIAEQMGMHPVSIGLIARTAIFQSEMAKLESQADFQVIKRAEALSNEALDTLKVLMRKAKSQSLQKSCADSILDRAGYGKVEKKAIVAVSGEDVIRELNRRRRESSGAGTPDAIPNPGAEG